MTEPISEVGGGEYLDTCEMERTEWCWCSAGASKQEQEKGQRYRAGGHSKQKVTVIDSCECTLGLWRPQGYVLSPILFALDLAPPMASFVVLKANAITAMQMIFNWACYLSFMGVSVPPVFEPASNIPVNLSPS